MKSRLIVAVIGVPLLYLALLAPWNNQVVFALVVSLACSIALLELATMLRPLQPFVPAMLVPVTLSPILAWWLSETGIFAAMIAAIPLVLVFHGLSNDRDQALSAIMATLMPVFYIAPSAGLIVILRNSPEGFGVVVLLLAAVFLNDTGAFFVGRTFGKHKLAPRLSPNKSIEGFVGGFVVGTMIIWYGGHFILLEDGESLFSGVEALAVGVCVALATPVGDLFESLLKRAAGVKDSGTFLGDHGGALDRIDALLFAIPVMYVGAFLSGVL